MHGFRLDEPAVASVLEVKIMVGGELLEGVFNISDCLFVFGKFRQCFLRVIKRT